MARALELGAQLAVVVDLAVLDDVTVPSSFVSGWSPRLEVDDREAPRARARPARRRRAPCESGPRWRSVSRIASSRRGSTSPCGSAIPQIPHTRVSLCAASGQTSRPTVAARATRRGHDPQVQPDRAVGDPLEVVRELLGPGLLAAHPRLREARSGPDARRAAASRRGSRRRAARRRPAGSGAARRRYMSPRRTFQSCGSSSSCEARRKRPSVRRLLRHARGQLLAVGAAEPALRVRPQRAELPHREDAAVASHALAAVEDRPAGRDAGRRPRSAPRTGASSRIPRGCDRHVEHPERTVAGPRARRRRRAAHSAPRASDRPKSSRHHAFHSGSRPCTVVGGR